MGRIFWKHGLDTAWQARRARLGEHLSGHAEVALITLKVKQASDGASRLTSGGTAQTKKIGNNLFAAVVTARAAGAGDRLVPGTIYAYDLEATGDLASVTSLRNAGFFSRPGENYSNSQLAYPNMTGVVASLAGLPTGHPASGRRLGVRGW